MIIDNNNNKTMIEDVYIECKDVYKDKPVHSC